MPCWKFYKVTRYVIELGLNEKYLWELLKLLRKTIINAEKNNNNYCLPSLHILKQYKKKPTDVSGMVVKVINSVRKIVVGEGRS